MASGLKSSTPVPASTESGGAGAPAGVAATDTAAGLSTPAAQVLLREHGYNEVTEQPEHPTRRFLGKFWGMSAWMLRVHSVACPRIDPAATS